MYEDIRVKVQVAGKEITATGGANLYDLLAQGGVISSVEIVGKDMTETHHYKLTTAEEKQEESNLRKEFNRMLKQGFLPHGYAFRHRVTKP